MRHERISVATKMSRDALECRPCTYEIPVLTGVPQRTRPGPGLGDGNSMSDMDWLVMVGEDPLSNLMVRPAPAKAVLQLTRNALTLYVVRVVQCALDSTPQAPMDSKTIYTARALSLPLSHPGF
jgi:hypothetical protein